MAKAQINFGEVGVGGGTLTEYIKNQAKTNDGGYTFTVSSSRADINEKYLYIDTTNKFVYLYCDFTLKASFNANGDIIYITTVPSCMPGGSNNLINNAMPTTKNGSIANGNCMKITYTSGSSTLAILSNTSVTSGDRYVLCTAWQYS